MIKNSKRKPTDNNKNILYLHENDAKALGIVEGGVQRVFVDGREVEVTFVDEHEVIPMSNEERKIFEEADKLAARYIAESKENARQKENDDYEEGLAERRREERRAERTPNRFDRYANHERGEREEQKESFIKRLFGSHGSNNRRQLPDEDEVAREEEAKAWRREQAAKERAERERERQERLSSSRELRTMKRQAREEMKREEFLKKQEASKRKHSFKVRSDIFTEEELEILQGIISKTKDTDDNNSRPRTSSGSSKVKTVKSKR